MFYNNYQQSAAKPLSSQPKDDELAAGFGSPTGLLPKPHTPAGSTTPFTQGGSASPASQIQTTGNTGMNAPAGGSTSPATPQTTTGTPSSATGSGLPAYGSHWGFSWQNVNSSTPLPGPGGTTIYNAPGSLGQMGVDPRNIANYNPTAGPSWESFDPNNANGASAAKTALQSLLSGDASGMDTSALKNRLKEQRLMMEGDQRSASRQAAAGRGMLDSGFQAADERRIASAARKDILGGFRDVDIAAAELGAKNKITAAGVLDQVLTGETGRASTGFNNALEGSKFGDDQDRFAVGASKDKEQFALDAALGLEDLKKSGAESSLNSWQAGADATLKSRDQDIEVAKGRTNELLGRLGLSVQLDDIARSSSRDKMQFLTDIFNTLTKQEQFNAQMGLNYNQMGMSMNEILANVAKSIGV